MPVWVQDLLAKILVALLAKAGSALQDWVMDQVIDMKASRTNTKRSKVIVSLIDAKELDDDSIIELHRRLRDIG